MSDPVMLYYAPHHSHERMADAIDAELIKAVRGAPQGRINTARKLDLGDRPVITEGGQPLFQAAWMKIFGNCGPIIHLAADETLMNIFNSLPHYSIADRAAHFWAHRYVDAVLAVSPRLSSEGRALGTHPVKTIHPFAEDWKYENMQDVTPDPTSQRIMAVGSYKPKNNFDILEDIARKAESDVFFEVFGPDTDQLGSEHVTGHGFVDKSDFVEYFNKSQAFILPSRSQAFPVSVLEAMHAGLPPIITDEVGTEAYVRKIHPKLVAGCDTSELAKVVDWYTGLDPETKQDIIDETAVMGEFFTPEKGLETFEEAYHQVISELEEG